MPFTVIQHIQTAASYTLVARAGAKQARLPSCTDIDTERELASYNPPRLSIHVQRDGLSPGMGHNNILYNDDCNMIQQRTQPLRSVEASMCFSPERICHRPSDVIVLVVQLQYSNTCCTNYIVKLQPVWPLNAPTSCEWYTVADAVWQEQLLPLDRA